MEGRTTSEIELNNLANKYETENNNLTKKSNLQSFINSITSVHQVFSYTGSTLLILIYVWTQVEKCSIYNEIHSISEGAIAIDCTNRCSADFTGLKYTNSNELTRYYLGYFNTIFSSDQVDSNPPCDCNPPCDTVSFNYDNPTKLWQYYYAASRTSNLITELIYNENFEEMTISPVIDDYGNNPESQYSVSYVCGGLTMMYPTSDTFRILSTIVSCTSIIVTFLYLEYSGISLNHFKSICFKIDVNKAEFPDSHKIIVLTIYSIPNVIIQVLNLTYELTLIIGLVWAIISGLIDLLKWIRYRCN